MAKQGCSFTEQEVKRIVTLLSETDMTILEISQRMGCSRSSVVAINRRFQVRRYEGHRSKWSLQTLEESVDA